ncbi:type II toxin-antitoxin system PemK/MazF family toxin [Candidatus Saccharibacteria bacterium]|nr:type II toxin-antitoxin system PemK/MazF family toxin [Candidatus Saccharibacteria bacterium]
MTRPSSISQFDVYWVNLDPTIGREIKKTRPGIVVSPVVMNDALDTVIIVPLTSTIIDWPFRLSIKLHDKISSAACDQLRCVSKQRLGKKIASLNPSQKKQLNNVLNDIFAI